MRHVRVHFAERQRGPARAESAVGLGLTNCLEAMQVDAGLQACLDFLRELLLSRQADALNLDKWQFARVPVDLSQYLHVLVCVW